MDLLLQKVGVGKRTHANIADTENLCPVCDEMIEFGQKITFSLIGVPIHTYRCLKFYYAALYIYYGLDVYTLYQVLGIEVRKAYRIQRIARQILAGELANVPGRN